MQHICNIFGKTSIKSTHDSGLKIRVSVVRSRPWAPTKSIT
jgi:hypothetical protein